MFCKINEEIGGGLQDLLHAHFADFFKELKTLRILRPRAALATIALYRSKSFMLAFSFRFCIFLPQVVAPNFASSPA